MRYEPVIGLEVHAQLKTKSKIFCGCPTEFGGLPNDHACPVCLGHPGVLPVLNRSAVEFAIRAGIALNCQIAETTKFDRKNYFYPDLPKNYQITQFDKPICKEGFVDLKGKKIRIHRAHLEEDAGKLIHAGATGLHGSDYSFVDFNRAGVPLLEIVSEPDISSPEEAKDYLMELRTVLRYLDVCDGNLEEGSFRCDANISMRPEGQTKLGVRAEIKNMNSFRAVQHALEFEIERQTKMLETGERVVQETRLWNEATGSTHPMRSKEESHDYRYFPEPDLVPLVIGRAWVDEIQAQLPELPKQRRERYAKDCGLSVDDAAILAEAKELSDFYDRTLQSGAPAKAAANWVMGPTIAYLKENKQDITQTALTPENVKEIVDAVSGGVLNSSTAKQLLFDCLKTAGSVKALIQEKGLTQLSDETGLRDMVEAVLKNNPSQFADYKSGKTKLRQFFFGETMKVSKGKANPQVVNKLLDELLDQ